MVSLNACRLGCAMQNISELFNCPLHELVTEQELVRITEGFFNSVSEGLSKRGVYCTLDKVNLDGSVIFTIRSGRLETVYEMGIYTHLRGKNDNAKRTNTATG